MRISSIQLENIKSYQRAVIYLRDGTTAIRGHNGAGKSTLVEAIGFALFDALNYDQAQFVREGEKAGTVTITFISALDGREYQVVRRCGTGAIWYVFDPELQGRVAEQKVDVTDFLRTHFRLEADVSLKDLFNDAIGVPQGTFTADFIMTPTNRRKKFDALLRVEEYRKAAEKLADTRSYIQEQQRAQDQLIATFERETSQLDDWRLALDTRRQQARQKTIRLTQLAVEIDNAVAQRDTLNRQKAQVERAATNVELAGATLRSAEEKVSQAERQAQEAREAVRIRAENERFHRAHLAARQRFTTAQDRRNERDALWRRRAQITQHLEGATTSHRHTRERLQQALDAERQVAELAPLALRQMDLERERDAARQNCQRLEEANRALAKNLAERAQVERDLTDAMRIIAELEALRPLADMLDMRREKVSQLQDLRARRTERQKRQRAIEAEQTQVTQQRAKATQAVAKERENVRKLVESRAIAEQAPQLKERYATMQGEAQRLEARQEHHRLSREQSGAGACPFLREPCLNIRQRGENSLGSYFDKLIAEDERALEPLRHDLAQLAKEVEHAQKVRSYYERLEEFQERYRLATDSLTELDERAARLSAEQQELTDWLSASPDERELAEAQGLFKQSDDADKRLREIAPRQAEAKRLQTRLAQLAADVDEQNGQTRSLAGAPEELRSVEAALAKLGDPRRQVAALESSAGERGSLEAQVAALENTLTNLRAQQTQTDEALRPFATLDDEIRAIEVEIAATQEGYTRYLQYEHTAGRLPEYDAALAQTKIAAETARATHEQAIEALGALAETYAPEELERVSRRVDDLNNERGGVTTGLHHMQREAEMLEREIARVTAMMGELEAARREREELGEEERMLQQFRETIKEAGPNIMKALLRQISTEANRIFGEILGDRAAQLTWENDYEIVLRRDGKERTFAQLSGGEQMSAALSVRLALLRNLTRLDLAFFDEPTQNMDDERRINLAEQIRRVRGFDQLVVISHDDTFEQGLDSVIHLEKRNGQTVAVDEDALVSVQ